MMVCPPLLSEARAQWSAEALVVGRLQVRRVGDQSRRVGEMTGPTARQDLELTSQIRYSVTVACGGSHRSIHSTSGGIDRSSLTEEIIVAAVCDVCGKGPGFGKSVSHSHVRTNRRWNPNIQRVRAIVEGTPKRLNVCTKCLKSDRVTRAI